MRTLPKHRAREYETIFIMNPGSDEDAIGKISDRCQGLISRLEGKLLVAENWGIHRLAYPVSKQQKGIYIYLRYLGYQDLVHELERNFRMVDTVIKYLTVKVAEDVNPEARPVQEENISFLAPRYQESAPAATEESTDESAGEEADAEETAAAEVEAAPAEANDAEVINNSDGKADATESE